MTRTPQIQFFRPDVYEGIELHSGTAVRREVPRHWHEEYHLCAHTAGAGALCYRGTEHHNPIGSVNMVEPGEVHSNRTDHPEGCDYRALNFDASHFAIAVEEVTSRSGTPAFVAPVSYDPETYRRFVRLHQALVDGEDLIEQQVLFLGFLVSLLERHTAAKPSLKPAKREKRAVNLVRDYLSANYSERIDLARLSRLTGLSPYHLTRVFAADTGLPPHAFLKQVRISRAMALLRQKNEISRVALETGFADQSHLTRSFKHIVGISPGAYSRLTASNCGQGIRMHAPACTLEA